MHVAVDVESCELLCSEVTDETVHDIEVLEDLIQGINLENCVGDAAYPLTHQLPTGEETDEGSRTSGNKDQKSSVVRGNTARDRAVKEQQELGYEKWKEQQNYGKRWMVETFFSNVKRCFGETVRAKTPETSRKEVERKLLMYSTIAKMFKAT